MQPGERRLGYQPALQGVRAIAVLAVFAFHVGQLPGGWLGVEIFFVLSGFLITTLLLEEAVSGDASRRAFYVKRAARLLPAATVVLAVLLAFCMATGAAMASTARAALATLLYYANWLEVSGAGTEGLGHTWSLSIEEQFYFVWPLLLLWAVSRWGARSVLVMAVAGFILSAALRVALAGGTGWFERVYYGSDTRAAGLLAGCAAGALLARRGLASSRVPEAAALAGAAFVGAALLVSTDHAVLTWKFGVTTFDVVVAVLLVALVNGRGILARLLSWRPAVYLGEISYGLYLWHLPVIWAAGLYLDGPVRLAVQVGLPFLLAAVSYRWVERPARRWIVGRWAGPAIGEPRPDAEQPATRP